MSQRVLILGGNGMLGHKLWQHFQSQFETYVTFRKPVAVYGSHPFFAKNKDMLIGEVETGNFDSIVRTVARVRPTVIINAVGVIKQIEAAKDPLPSLKVNSLFPHQLADLCQACQVRLIQISTDCVFSGQRGNYSETDLPDATDLYGRTKLLGELNRSGCLTIRTSIIGHELERHTGLLDWFLRHPGPRVQGYSRAIFSGFTTLALAKIMAEVIIPQPDLTGLYHVSSEPISKYDLLCRVRDAFHKNITIEPYSDFICDRSLDSSQFQRETGWQPPDWDTMIQELIMDSHLYQNMGADR